MGIEPVGSLQALVFAAMFSGVVSMPEEIIMHDFGVGKKDLVDNFQQGAETALVRANLLRTTKIETMQAFVMYMVSIPFLLKECALHSRRMSPFLLFHECVLF